MGDWHISVQGTGAHHNPDYEKDADKRFEEFVSKLKEDGHTITYASFTHGARQVANA